MLPHPPTKDLSVFTPFQLRASLLCYSIVQYVAHSAFRVCVQLLMIRHINTTDMHTFKFTLLAVLSYVAVIGATPLGPAEAIDRRQ